MMVTHLPRKYKQKKKSWQWNIKKYIKWERKQAFSLSKTRIKTEAVPILTHSSCHAKTPNTSMKIENLCT